MTANQWKDSPWTDAAIATLKRLWPEPAMSCAKIAKEIGNGVSRCSVIGKGRRLGLGPKPSDHAKTNTEKRLQHLPPKPKPFKPKPPRNFGGVWGAYPDKEPEPFVPRVVEAAPSLSKSILSVTDSDCRWPTHEDAETGEHRFCGHPSVSGLPYCEAHSRIAFHQKAERTPAQKANDAKMRERGWQATRTRGPSRFVAEDAA